MSMLSGVSGTPRKTPRPSMSSEVSMMSMSGDKKHRKQGPSAHLLNGEVRVVRSDLVNSFDKTQNERVEQAVNKVHALADKEP